MERFGTNLGELIYEAGVKVTGYPKTKPRHFSAADYDRLATVLGRHDKYSDFSKEELERATRAAEAIGRFLLGLVKQGDFQSAREIVRLHQLSLGAKVSERHARMKLPRLIRSKRPIVITPGWKPPERWSPKPSEMAGSSVPKVRAPKEKETKRGPMKASQRQRFKNR